MLNYWNYWLFITTDKSSNRLEWLLTKTCTENIFMSHCNTVYYTSWLQVNLNDISDFYKNTHQLHLTQERNVVKEEEGLDDPSLFLPLFRAEIHHSVQKRAEEKPSGSREKWREKEKEVGRVPVGLVWGWKLIYCGADEERHARRQWVLFKPLLRQHKTKQGPSLPL